MYVAIYDIEHNYLGVVKEVVEDITRKVYEFDTTSFSGFCEDIDEIYQGVYGLFNDDRGNTIYAGLLKDLKPEKDRIVKFKLDDFRKIFDRQILLDFSQDTSPDHSLDAIFQKVMDEIISNDDIMHNKINISYTIPTDSSNTKVIADYTHEYIIENAWKFLKVYLSYYQYHIECKFNSTLHRIEIEFKKETNERQVFLPDFKFERQSTSIKTNKTIATLSYEINAEPGDNVWISATGYDYSTAPSDMRDSGTSRPSPTSLPDGFIFRKEIYESGAYTWSPTTKAVYDSSNKRGSVSVFDTGATCPLNGPSLNEMISEAGSASSYSNGYVIRGNYWIDSGGPTNCFQYSYMKVVYEPGDVSYEYYEVDSTIIYNPRPNLIERVYILGNDNEIYSGYPDLTKRIYPVKTKIFEANYLSEAQFNAVLELVNSRYNENIVIENLNGPTDLSDVSLYEFFNVYDKDGNIKVLPVSEIKLVKGQYSIKLGFKKTLFTEIVNAEE